MDGLELEQEFLHLFPESLAVRTLLRFDPDYRRQFYNLSGVLLRCVLVTALRREITGDRTASSAVCRYLAPELHGFVQQLAVTRQEGLGHLAVCME